MNLDNGPVTLALAMFVGVVAHGIARHLRVPGIVLLLIAGVVLGPDVADLIRPGAMGSGLIALVGFAVAIILFEGGLSLRLPVLRSQALPIRRLVTIGALVTGGLAAVTARLAMGWDWRLSILFGTLVIVTGPTVVTPILRRLRLSQRLSSILIAEGIFIDAVGATIAVVALEIALEPTHGAAANALSIFLRVGVGAAVGLGAGAVLAVMLRIRRFVPHGLENVLVVATVLATFHVSNAAVGESGITAAIVAGLVVGNAGIRLHHAVVEFNEQLTALFVATLFVLLAADVRLVDVVALGWRGVVVVALLMLVVRPATIFASTFGTDLTLREKLFLSWLAPRGIVAAAVASLFAIELAQAGVAGGVEMRALVFVVIATTVVIQGITAAPVGRLLGVRRPTRSGYLILGANALARVFGEVLRGLGERVVFVDNNEELCQAAADQRFDAIHGDGLEPEVLEKAGIDDVAHAIGLTANEHVNFRFTRRILEELRGPELHVALERLDSIVTPTIVERHDIHMLFAVEHDLTSWLQRARQRGLTTQRWKLRETGEWTAADMPRDQILPLVLLRRDAVEPFTQRTSLRQDDEMIAAIATEHLDAVTTWLSAHGWVVASAVDREHEDAAQAPRDDVVDEPSVKQPPQPRPAAVPDDDQVGIP